MQICVVVFVLLLLWGNRISVMAAEFPAGVEMQIQQMINSEQELNIKIDGIAKLLADHNISYYVEEKPEAFLTHPDNRGGLMLNHYEVHQKAATMIRVGVQLSKLTESVCFELSKVPAVRQQQLKRNADVIALADGMLASVNGSERYLTIGTSHTVAFCKAVNAQCKTIPNELALSQNGVLSMAYLLTGKAPGHPLESMLARGWKWLVVPAWVEECFPSLPALWQLALNSSHAVNKAATEMEVASTIAQFYTQMKLGSNASDASLEKAVQAAAQSEPKCKPYLQTIGHYVRTYAGGDSFPIIHFLESFSKMFGGSLIIGEEFMTAITYADFKGNDTLFPFRRAAALAVQLTSPKSQDGIAKCLHKSDVDRMKSKAFAPKLLEAEQTMALAYDVLKQAALPLDLECAIFGRFLTRVMLHILNKEKAGREMQCFPNLTAINERFKEEVLQRQRTATLSAPVCSGSSSTEIRTLADASDPAKIALLNNPHMEEGQFYTHKDHKDNIFQFTEISMVCVTMVARPLFGAEVVVKVNFADLKSWRRTKADRPVACSAALAEQLQPLEAHSLRDHLQVAQVFAALTAAHKKYTVDVANYSFSDLVFVQNPSAVYTNRNFKKHELKLLPAGLVSRVLSSSTGPPVNCMLRDMTPPTMFGVPFAVSPPRCSANFARSNLRNSLEAGDTSVLVPYFWVGQASDQQTDSINMELSSIMWEGWLQIPMLTNPSSIKKHSFGDEDAVEEA